MTPIIYGIDTDKNKIITPLMVRDALLTCFYEAHREDSSMENDEETNKIYCQELVKKAFTEAEANFDEPSKQDIMAAMGKLSEFAKNFRDQSIVQKHYGQIMQLVNKME